LEDQALVVGTKQSKWAEKKAGRQASLVSHTALSCAHY